ncbi:MAG: hypothetical protein J6R85_03560 [Lentisphaeria bacterium]|nr:hypothetical protein [Lentisphaeria bacterium]
MTPETESRIDFGRILWFAGFLLLILAALLGTKSDVTMTGVESSRMALVQSLADHGTSCIDQSFFRTLDQGIVDGKRFSDKPPLLSVTGAGIYALLKCCGISFETHYSLTVYLVTLLLMLPVNVLIVLTAWRILRIALPDAPEPYRITGAFLTVFSTLVWSYSVTFNNHTPAALMILLLALVLLEPGFAPSKRALLAGLCAAVLGTLEYVLGGAFGLAGAAYFAWKRDWRSCGIFCGAGAAGVILAGVLNYCNHGSALPLYLATHNPSVVGKNLLHYAWDILFGCKGMFLFTPALLWVFFAAGKEERDPAKPFLLGAMGLTVVLYWFGSSDLGGWC